MAMTITEKILAKHAGKIEVKPGEFIEANVDIEDINDDALINEMALTLKKDTEERDLYLPDDIFDQSDKSFEEMLPKKKRIYIRKYFGEIRKYGME